MTQNGGVLYLVDNGADLGFGKSGSSGRYYAWRFVPQASRPVRIGGEILAPFASVLFARGRSVPERSPATVYL